MSQASDNRTVGLPVRVPAGLGGLAGLFAESSGLVERMYAMQLAGGLTLSLEKGLWGELVEGLRAGADYLTGDAGAGYRAGIDALTRGIYDLYPLRAADTGGEVELVLGKVFPAEGGGEGYYSAAAGVLNGSYDGLISEYDSQLGPLSEALLKSSGYKIMTVPASFPELRCLDVFSLAGGLNVRHKPICVFFSGGSRENVSSLSRMTVFVNLYAARWKAVTEMLASRYVAGAECLSELSAHEAAGLLVLWLRGHDAGHFVGADRLSKTMSEFDRDYMVLHELKSDMISLYNMKHLSGGLLSGGLREKGYLMAVAEMLRYIRRGGCYQHADSGSAYLAYRHFRDMGVIRPDPWEGKFVVDLKRLEEVVDEFTVSLVRLFAEGNSTRARGFVNSWGWLGVEEDDGLPRGCPEELRKMLTDPDIPHYLDYDFRVTAG